MLLRTDGHAFRDCQSRRPLIPQDVQANRPVAVDVRVVDLGREADLRRLKRVIRGEGDAQEENTSGVGRVSLMRVCREHRRY